MKITGETTIPAPAEAVWAGLHDPSLLARVIPGCQRLEVRGAGQLHLGVTVAMPAVAGTYSGDAVISEQSASSLLMLRLAGAGGPGVIDAAVEVRISPAGPESTELAYQVDAEVDGAIAAVGQRMLAGVASRLAGEFTSALSQMLAEPDGAGLAGAGLAEHGLAEHGLALDGLAEDALAGAGSDLALGVNGGTGSELADEPAARAGWSGIKSGLMVTAAVGLSGAVIGLVLRRLRRAPSGLR